MEEREQAVAPLTQPRLLQDSLSVGFIAAAVLLDFAIMLIVVLRYSSLPDMLVMHWNVDGAPDRIGPTRQIWIIPIISWLVTIGNFAFAWGVDAIDRFAARFLLAATLVVELMALIALYMLIH
jgi:uncharacterized membrane protein